MRPLAKFQTLAMPHTYRTLIIRDPDVTEIDSEIMRASTADVITGDVWNIIISSLQDLAKVTVSATIWPSEPPGSANGGEWDGARRLRLHSDSGTLLVQEMSVGTPGQWALPQPGTYEVLARWRGREENGKLVSDIYSRANEESWETEEIFRRLADLAGRERYHFDMWYSPDQISDEDD